MQIYLAPIFTETKKSFEWISSKAYNLWLYFWNPIADLALSKILSDHSWKLQPKPFMNKVKAYAAFFFSQHKKGTFDHQDNLPHLPIPPIEKTLEKFRKSVYHLINDQERNELDEAIDLFKQEEGPALQLMLQEYAKEKNCWLKEIWMNAYLMSRKPLIYSTNWYGCNSINIPDQYDPKSIQTARLARICHHLLNIHERIESNMHPRLHPSICMDPYRYIYGSTRIPGKEIDTLVTTKSKHIAVFMNGNIYKLNIYHHGKLLSESELKTQFQKIKTDADKEPLGDMVSYLTCGDRSIWHEDREELKILNQKSLEIVESALICIRLLPHKPQTLQERSSIEFSNSQDAWYDKYVISITANGSISGIHEHTPYDADTPSHLIEDAFKNEKYKPEELQLPPPRTDLPSPEKITWKLNDAQKTKIQNRKATINKYMNNIDLVVEKFEDYGKSFIQKLGMSPDSYFQMALQWAYYQQHNELVLTYETAGLRFFKEARTETQRSSTAEAKEMCEALNTSQPKETLRLAIRKAVDLHKSLMEEMKTGQGFDRHLLGLRAMNIVSRQPLAKFFETAAYKMPFKLATSQTPSENSEGGGFHPIEWNGYGVSYFPRKDYFIYHISSYKLCEEVNSNNLAISIKNSLKQFQEIFKD